METLKVYAVFADADATVEAMRRWNKNETEEQPLMEVTLFDDQLQPIAKLSMTLSAAETIAHAVSNARSVFYGHESVSTKIFEDEELPEAKEGH
jgi:hypothetical protein